MILERKAGRHIIELSCLSEFTQTQWKDERVL